MPSDPTPVTVRGAALDPGRLGRALGLLFVLLAAGCSGGGGASGGPPNAVPSIATPTAQVSAEGDLVSIQVSALDPDGDALAFSALGLPEGLAISAGGQISGEVAFTAAGAHVVDLSASDGRGGVASALFSWTVSNTDRPPTFTSTPSTEAREDVAYAYVAEAPDPDAGDATTLTLLAGPTGMTLDASSGALAWTPSEAEVGSHAVTIHATSGGLTAEQAFTLVVASVNDAPGFTKGPDEALLEDAGARSVTGWATGLSTGSPGEASQSLSFSVTNDLARLFSTPPAVSPSGTLTYALAPDEAGTARVTVTLRDDGGTANGGFDAGPAQTFTIAVTPVNDAPSFTRGADQVVEVGAAPQAIPGWASGISAGPAGEAGQALAFDVTSTAGALFSAPPALTPAGTLTFALAAGATGTASVTVTLRDDGGTASGGVDASAPQMFTITVSPATPAAPVITSTTLPFGEQGVAYAAQLTASGGTGALTFSLEGSSAALPTGLGVSPDGAIAGTPSAAVDARTVRLRVTDAALLTSTRDLTISIDPAFTVTPEVLEPIPVSGVATFVAAGGRAPYSALLSVNQSGGVVTGTGATLSYRAGGADGQDTIDVFDARMRVRTVVVAVRDPFASFAPRDLTDRWRVDFQAKRGSHPYRSDLERQLVRLGLRATTATGAGALQDELALALVHARTLGEVARLYRLDADGAPNPSSFRISLFRHVPAGLDAPPEGGALTGAALLYNVMEIGDHGRSSDGIVGRALLDIVQGVRNERVENIAGASLSGGDRLGIDTPELTSRYLSLFPGRSLASVPVNASDVPVLQSLLAGGVPSGARAAAIAGLVDHFSYRLAVLVAHEIGHALGLEHNGSRGSSVMASVLEVDDSLQASFSSSDVIFLGSVLPGRGRDGISPAMVGGYDPALFPMTAVEQRAGRGCELRLSDARR